MTMVRLEQADNSKWDKFFFLNDPNIVQVRNTLIKFNESLPVCKNEIMDFLKEIVANYQDIKCEKLSYHIPSKDEEFDAVSQKAGRPSGLLMGLFPARLNLGYSLDSVGVSILLNSDQKNIEISFVKNREAVRPHRLILNIHTVIQAKSIGAENTVKAFKVMVNKFVTQWGKKQGELETITLDNFANYKQIVKGVAPNSFSYYQSYLKGKNERKEEKEEGIKVNQPALVQPKLNTASAPVLTNVQAPNNEGKPKINFPSAWIKK